MASEAGTLPVEAKNIARKWRLQPGKIFLIDFKKQRIVDDSEVKSNLVDSRPWKRWLDENLIELESLPQGDTVHDADFDTLLVRQHAFGYTNEDLRLLMLPMLTTGQEAVGSMGTDTPLACLSDKPQLLFSYFKQLFAQVTNPPLDAIREELVTSLITYLGREGNLLTEAPTHARLIKLKTPIINNAELAKLRSLNSDEHKAVTISTLFDACDPETGLKNAIDRVCNECVEAIKNGATLLILSDRGVDKDNAPIPSLLAKCITSACFSATARERSIRTWRWRRSAICIATASSRRT
jgi:hypothetical protein